MTGGVRCTDCQHFIRKQARCPVSQRRQPVYQNSKIRNCKQHQPPALPDWRLPTTATQTCWHIAALDRGRVEYFTLQFPREVGARMASIEAARHWKRFVIRPARRYLLAG